MTIGLRPFAAVVRIGFAEVFAYPITAFLWVLVDSQSAMVLPAVWTAAAGGKATIAGMQTAQVVNYYIVILAVSPFVVSHLMWDIGFDIREGLFSTQLLRPFSYFRFCAARNFAWRILRLGLFLPVFGLVWFAYGGFKGQPLHLDLHFWLALVLAHVLSYVAAFALAMIALWTTEYWSLFEAFYVPEMVLSGRIVPLSSLPDWCRTLADYAHFRYTVSFPSEIALGRLTSQQIGFGFTVQCTYILLFVVAGRILFLRGVRQYTGFGN